jgi:methylphosphotriester-DNA--protein-cysteine methyltransferase
MRTRSTNPRAYGGRFANTGARHTKNTARAAAERIASGRSSPRSLQRVFRTYVGVGPKWIIRLYRIKEAAARIEDGNVTTWADLALRLGYADQAHFVDDFRRIIGRPPARYAGAIHRSTARFMDSSIPGSGIHDQ